MAKVLSLLQPWAWAIIHGPKRVENRVWRTTHRGRLYIHAGKSMRALDAADPAEWAARFGVPFPDRAALAFGAILGSVEVVDCVPVDDVRGDPWASGPWCWVLADSRPLPVPKPCRGAQRLFAVPDDLN